MIPFVGAAVLAAVIAPASLVDTFVGTSGTQIGGPIDTFPGADTPFGMLQWSPDTPSQNAGGGYEYTDTAITGFQSYALKRSRLFGIRRFCDATDAWPGYRPVDHATSFFARE